MKKYHLDLTKKHLSGPTIEQIVFNNQWAATAFDQFHADSTAEINLKIDGNISTATLTWDSNFSKAAMKEKIDMANHGGVAMCWFVMSVLMNFRYAEQSEIGDGVDYRFRTEEPSDDDLNFLDDFHYVEVSGILKENASNTIEGRIKDKHSQINKGSKSNKTSSVIVTEFHQPKTIKELHN